MILENRNQLVTIGLTGIGLATVTAILLTSRAENRKFFRKKEFFNWVRSLFQRKRNNTEIDIRPVDTSKFVENIDKSQSLEGASAKISLETKNVKIKNLAESQNKAKMSTEGDLETKNANIENSAESRNKAKMSTDGETSEILNKTEEINDSLNGTIEEENGLFKMNVPLDHFYFRHIIGRGGKTKRSLESETNTEISLPARGQNGNLVISGHSESSVSEAKNKIENIVKRLKKELTHFVSLPIISDDVQNKFLEFKKEVLEKCKDDKGISEDLFVSSARLHLTVGVLTLATEPEIQKALSVLESCKETVFKPLLKDKELKVAVKGLGHFERSNLSNIRVLFSNVTHLEEPQLLQNLMNKIKNEFVKEGLFTRLREEEEENLNIHVTLMKVKRHAKIRSFNAKNIFKQFGDYDFGEAVIKEIELSVFGDNDLNSYYKSAGNVNISC